MLLHRAQKGHLDVEIILAERLVGQIFGEGRDLVAGNDPAELALGGRATRRRGSDRSSRPSSCPGRSSQATAATARPARAPRRRRTAGETREPTPNARRSISVLPRNETFFESVARSSGWLEHLSPGGAGSENPATMLQSPFFPEVCRRGPSAVFRPPTPAPIGTSRWPGSNARPPRRIVRETPPHASPTILDPSFPVWIRIDARPHSLVRTWNLFPHSRRRLGFFVCATKHNLCEQDTGFRTAETAVMTPIVEGSIRKHALGRLGPSPPEPPGMWPGVVAVALTSDVVAGNPEDLWRELI